MAWKKRWCLYISFYIYVPFWDVQAIHAMCTKAPQDHHLCWLLVCEKFRFWSIKPQIAVKVCLLLHHSILNDLGPRDGNGVSGSCSYIVSSLHGRFLACICRCSDELCSHTSVPEVFWFFSFNIWYDVNVVFLMKYGITYIWDSYKSLSYVTFLHFTKHANFFLKTGLLSCLRPAILLHPHCITPSLSNHTWQGTENAETAVDAHSATEGMDKDLCYMLNGHSLIPYVLKQ